MKYLITDGELFWSNEHGWVSIKEATQFEGKETVTLQLPMTANNSAPRWVSVFQAQAYIWAKLVTSMSCLLEEAGNETPADRLIEKFKDLATAWAEDIEMTQDEYAEMTTAAKQYVCDFELPSQQTLYSVGTFDPELNAFTPQCGIEKSINLTRGELREVLKLLRNKYCYAANYSSNNPTNSDPYVFVERTDGESENSILERWKHKPVESLAKLFALEHGTQAAQPTVAPPSKFKAKYNSMLDLGFTVEHDFDDPYDLIEKPENLHLVFDAIQKRLDALRLDPKEAAEAFGLCDTYEHQ
jgi:hypothetical protein